MQEAAAATCLHPRTHSLCVLTGESDWLRNRVGLLRRSPVPFTSSAKGGAFFHQQCKASIRADVRNIGKKVGHLKLCSLVSSHKKHFTLRHSYVNDSNFMKNNKIEYYGFHFNQRRDREDGQVAAVQVGPRKSWAVHAGHGHGGLLLCQN